MARLANVRPKALRVHALSSRTRRIAALVVGAVAVAGASIAAGNALTRIDPEHVTPAAVPSVDGPRADLPLADLARSSLSRVVTVEALISGAEELGTAWLLDDKGDFVTNAHVIAGQRAVRIRDRDAHTYAVQVRGVDQDEDLAVVRVIGGSFPGTPLPVYAGRLQPPGDAVALASDRATGHEAASPVRIVRLHVDVPARGADVEPRVGAGRLVYRDMLALDGSRVYAGNSGGPLLDAGGRVVGIVTLASRSTPQAFAIPVSRVIGKLKSLAGS